MKLRLLVGVLAVLLGLELTVWWFDRGARARSAGSALVDTGLIDLPELDQAHRIVIREKPQSKLVHSENEGFEVRLIVDDDEPIRETVLERRDDGSWVVANLFDLPVDQEWLGQTMRDLSQGRLTRHVTSDPELMERLDLHLGQVRLEDKTGRIIRQLDFGRKDGGDTYQFVRVNQRDAYIGKHETELLGDPYVWIKTRLFEFAPGEVREVSFPFQDREEKPLLLRRTEPNGPLQIVSETLPNPEYVSRHLDEILGRLLNESIMLAFKRDSAVTEAAKQHSGPRLHLELFDGRTFTVTYAVLPEDHPSLQETDADSRTDLAIALFETSDANSLLARSIAKSTFAFSKVSTVSRLPKNRAEGLTPAPAPTPVLP